MKQCNNLSEQGAQYMNYIEKFEKLGFGMFAHFGLYSVIGNGEWYIESNPNPNIKKYYKLPEKFKVAKNWAKDVIKTAKSAGCRYITLTTRHHDGFSLYDTCVRKYQPEAMIINNTGLSELGKVGHFEIDSVTFERGKPCFVDKSDKY